MSVKDRVEDVRKINIKYEEVKFICKLVELALVSFLSLIQDLNVSTVTDKFDKITTFQKLYFSIMKPNTTE